MASSPAMQAPAEGTPGARRLFVALCLGPELGRALAAEVAAALGGEAAAQRGFRLPRPDGLHATLLFLGDVAAAPRARLIAELARALAGAPAPELALGRPGAFPRRGKERVLWIGLAERGAPRLAALRERVLAGAARAGFDVAKERAEPWTPHVTVARPRRPPGALAGFWALAPAAELAPRSVALVASVPAEGPAVYRSLAAFPLA